MDGKRAPQQQGGPRPKRGPANEFDDELIYDDDLAGDEVAATLPDDLDEADPGLGEAGRNWKRPPVAPMDPQKQSLGVFVCWPVYACADHHHPWQLN